MSGFGRESTQIKKVSVQDYSLQDLAFIYNVSKYLMRKRMERIKDKIGKRDGHYYDASQVRLIFQLIVLPSNVHLVK